MSSLYMDWLLILKIAYNEYVTSKQSLPLYSHLPIYFIIISYASLSLFFRQLKAPQKKSSQESQKVKKSSELEVRVCR
jgi:hypothetical protein